MLKITTTEIDLATVDAFRAELAELDRVSGPAVVDFGEVSFIESTGILALVCAARDAANQGRSFTVVNASEHTRRLLGIAGLGDLCDPRGAQEPPRSRAGTSRRVLSSFDI